MAVCGITPASDGTVERCRDCECSLLRQSVEKRPKGCLRRQVYGAKVETKRASSRRRRSEAPSVREVLAVIEPQRMTLYCHHCGDSTDFRRIPGMFQAGVPFDCKNCCRRGTYTAQPPATVASV